MLPEELTDVSPVNPIAEFDIGTMRHSPTPMTGAARSPDESDVIGNMFRESFW
jgi:hypothetical protein